MFSHFYAPMLWNTTTALPFYMYAHHSFTPLTILKWLNRRLHWSNKKVNAYNRWPCVWFLWFYAAFDGISSSTSDITVLKREMINILNHMHVLWCQMTWPQTLDLLAFCIFINTRSYFAVPPKLKLLIQRVRSSNQSFVNNFVHPLLESWYDRIFAKGNTKHRNQTEQGSLYYSLPIFFINATFSKVCICLLVLYSMRLSLIKPCPWINCLSCDALDLARGQFE